jgi:hypothetical protein
LDAALFFEQTITDDFSVIFKIIEQIRKTVFDRRIIQIENFGQLVPVWVRNEFGEISTVITNIELIKMHKEMDGTWTEADENPLYDFQM